MLLHCQLLSDLADCVLLFLLFSLYAVRFRRHTRPQSLPAPHRSLDVATHVFADLLRYPHCVRPSTEETLGIMDASL